MLKDARISKKLTQKKLGKLTGISQGYISKLERIDIYQNSPTLKQLVALSRGLEISPYQLTIFYLEKQLELEEYNINGKSGDLRKKISKWR